MKTFFTGKNGESARRPVDLASAKATRSLFPNPNSVF
ncbi:MAG: hypothetical protein ACI8QF_004176, partial [Limisphaerales bacterium]